MLGYSNILKNVGMNEGGFFVGWLWQGVLENE
jgi:hypothetical protein